MSTEFDKPSLLQRIVPMFLGFDWVLLLLIALLSGLGLLAMYSAGYDHGTRFIDHGRNMLLAAAILGDQCNYTIGRYFGPKVFQWENSRFFNRNAFNQAHNFYERHGPITIIIARFMPFIRTFAPFVAGVAEMSRTKFTAYNVGGALLWVLGIATAGYFFGNLPWVKENLDKIIWALILVPGLIAIAGAWKAGRNQPAQS